MLLLHLGPNVITDRTFITLGFKLLLQMGLLLRLGPMLLRMGPLLHLCLQQCAFDTERGDEWSLPAFASTSRDKKLALQAVKKIII